MTRVRSAIASTGSFFDMCRCVYLRAVSGRRRLGPSQRSTDGAVSQGAVLPSAGRTHLLGEPGPATCRSNVDLRVPGLQEATSHRPDLHRAAHAAHGGRAGSLDHAWSRTALRHQIAARYSPSQRWSLLISTFSLFLPVLNHLLPLQLFVYLRIIIGILSLLTFAHLTLLSLSNPALNLTFSLLPITSSHPHASASDSTFNFWRYINIWLTLTLTFQAGCWALHAFPYTYFYNRVCIQYMYLRYICGHNHIYLICIYNTFVIYFAHHCALMHYDHAFVRSFQALIAFLFIFCWRDMVMRFR